MIPNACYYYSIGLVCSTVFYITRTAAVQSILAAILSSSDTATTDPCMVAYDSSVKLQLCMVLSRCPGS